MINCLVHHPSKDFDKLGASTQSVEELGDFLKCTRVKVR